MSKGLWFRWCGISLAVLLLVLVSGGIASSMTEIKQYNAYKTRPTTQMQDSKGNCPDYWMREGRECIFCTRGENYDHAIGYCVRCNHYDTYIGNGMCSK